MFLPFLVEIVSTPSFFLPPPFLNNSDDYPRRLRRPFCSLQQQQQLLEVTRVIVRYNGKENGVCKCKKGGRREKGGVCKCNEDGETTPRHCTREEEGEEERGERQTFGTCTCDSLERLVAGAGQTTWYFQGGVIFSQWNFLESPSDISNVPKGNLPR